MVAHLVECEVVALGDDPRDDDGSPFGILDADDGGIDDVGVAEQDLFDALGIDSVQALELLSELERSFGVELPDYELAEVRSFADLAERIGDRL